MEDRFTSDEILEYINKELEKNISSTKKLALYTQATEKYLDDGISSLRIWLEYIKILQECEYDENGIREMFKMLVKKFFCFFDFWEAFIEFESKLNNHLKIVDKYEKWIVSKSSQEREKILNLFTNIRKTQHEASKNVKSSVKDVSKTCAMSNNGLSNIRTPKYTMNSKSDLFFVSNENKSESWYSNKTKCQASEKENNHNINNNIKFNTKEKEKDNRIGCSLSMKSMDNTNFINQNYNRWDPSNKAINKININKSNEFYEDAFSIKEKFYPEVFEKKKRELVNHNFVNDTNSPRVRKVKIDMDSLLLQFNENEMVDSYRKNIEKPLISYKGNFEVMTEEINKNITNQMKDIFKRENKVETVPELKCKGNEIIFKDTILTVIKQAGKGGGGVVYQVLHNSQIYALKKVKLPNERETILQGYLNEISILEKLKGFDEIIYFYDYEITDRYLLILMEYGETDLSTILKSNKKGIESVNYINYLWEQLLKAVHRIHQNRIIHRDLKPANFLLVQGKIKLIDFGIAKTIRNDTTNINIESQVGTINYMAPEAFDQERRKLGRSSDIWSLGCILYEMVYGYPPLDKFTNALHKIKNLQDIEYNIEYPEKSMKYLMIIINIKKCLIRDQTHRINIDKLLKSGLESDDKILLEKKDLKTLTKAVLNIKKSNNLNSNLVANSIVEEFLRKIGK